LGFELLQYLVLKYYESRALKVMAYIGILWAKEEKKDLIFDVFSEKQEQITDYHLVMA